MEGKLKVLGALFVTALFTMGCQPASVPGTGVSTGGTQTTVGCPSDFTTTGKLKYQDMLAATTTFDASPTAYWTNNEVADVTESAFSSSDYSTGGNLKCGKTYTPIAITTMDDMASVVGRAQVAESSSIEQTLEGHRIRTIQAKVKNLEIDTYANISSRHTSARSNSAFIQIGATGDGGTNITDPTGQTSFTIDADEYLNLRIDAKTNVTKAKYGEDDGFVYLCVDADSNKWSEPVVAVGANGDSLSDVFDNLNRNDQKAMNGYEYCYDVGQIKENIKSIYFYMQTASGVNPTTTDYPLLRFIAEGRYLSSKEKDANGDKKVIKGAFQDDTSNTEVLSADQQSIQIIIA